jgi:threonine dehydratase
MIQLIHEAAEYLAPRVRRTPIEPSPGLSEALGAPVFLKLEMLQITGSFKLRGAWFRLSRLREEERTRGVVTCSAGNHGKAIAHAAQQLGVRATIFVPSTVDGAKLAGMRSLGAEVVVARARGYDGAEIEARAEASSSGRPFVSAFDEPEIIAGNGGSLGLELLDQLPQLRTVIAPVSGGGLAAGLALALEHGAPAAALIGCQHRESPSLALSLERGEPVTAMPAIDTLAGGIEGGIGRSTFAILQHRIARVALVGEEAILQATRWLLDRHQYLVEPSGAAVVAACLEGRIGPVEGPVAVVLSGRNMAVESLERVLRLPPGSDPRGCARGRAV